MKISENDGQRAAEGRKQLKKGCFSCLVILLLIPVIYIFQYGCNSIFYPWSSSLFGPTLTGTWIGEVTTPDGDKRAMFLDLKLDDNNEEGDDLKGTAADCDSKRNKAEHFLTGRAGLFSANQFDLNYPNNPDFMEMASKLKWTWSGNNLNLTFQSTQKTSVSVQFKRGTQAEFDSLCQKLEGH